MAASVAFLHQAEYEATLQEYENEAAHRQHEEEEQDLTRTASDAALRAMRQGGAEGAARATASHQVQLRRNLLKGQTKPRDKSSAVASWLTAAGAGGGPAGGAVLSPTTGRKRTVASPSTGRSPSLRRSYSTIAKPSLWHRTVHADWRGITDSILPILNPDTRAKRTWDLVVMSMVVWTAVTVPLSVSFGMPHTTPWDVADYIMTVLFGVDLLINFRTAYYNHQGELIRDSSAIAANYMKMWFWIDLVGTVPFDSFVIGVGLVDPNNSSDNSAMAALGFLKAPRMLRLGRLLRFLDSFKNAKIFRIVQLFLAMILISHWLACIWYMMYRFGGKDNAELWAFNMATEHEDTVITSYVASYYYSFLLLVGDNINAYNNYERTFYVVVLIAGTFFYSAVVGQMATLVATMNVAVNRHAQKALMVQDALRYAGVPDQYNEKVQTYFEYLQARSHPGGEGMQFLGELPSSLHLRLCEFLHSRSLKKVPLFADCEEGFLSALALRMRMINLAPKEVIFRVGDAGKEMYVIKKGCVAVTSPRGQMWSLMVAGEVFGEVALLTTGKRTANCTALGFVDLALLTGPDLQAVMRDYPVSAAIIAERGAERARSLQTKNKMWLEVSDDEEELDDAWLGGDPDAEDLDAAGDNDSIGSAAPPEDAADGDAAAGSSDGDAGSSHSAKLDLGEGGSGSHGGGSEPGVAAKVTPAITAADGGTPKKAALLSGRSSPNGEEPAAAAARAPRPSSGRPMSARSGRLVAEAWSRSGEAAEAPETAAGGSRAVTRADSRGGEGAAGGPPVPRLSLELLNQDQPGKKPQEQQEQEPAGHGQSAAAPPPPPLLKPVSMGRRRGSATIADGDDAAAAAAPGSPGTTASGAAPAPLLRNMSVGRRMSMRRGSAQMAEGDEFAAAAAAAAAGMRTAAAPQQQTLLRQATNNRRQSMAFWLNDEASQGALAALAAGGSGAASPAAGTGSGAADGFTPKQDGDEIVWLAPRAGRRRSSDAVGAAVLDYVSAASGGLSSSRGPYQAARMQAAAAAAAAAAQQQHRPPAPAQPQPQAAALLPALLQQQQQPSTVPAAASAQLLHMTSSNLTYDSPGVSHRDGRGAGESSPAALAAAGGRPSTIPTRLPVTGLATGSRIVPRRGGSKEYSPADAPPGGPGHSAAAAAAAAAVAAAINGDPNWEQAAAEAVAASAAAARQGAWGFASPDSPGAGRPLAPPPAPLPPAPAPPPLLPTRLHARGGTLAGPVAEAVEGEAAQPPQPHPASPFATSALSPANLMKALGALSPSRSNRRGSTENLLGANGPASPTLAQISANSDDGGAAAAAGGGGPPSPLPPGLGVSSSAYLKVHRRGSGGGPMPVEGPLPLRSPGARRPPRLSTSSPEPPSRHHTTTGGGGDDGGGGGGGGGSGGGGCSMVPEEDLGLLSGAGRGEEPEWISTRTGLGRQVTRNGALRHGAGSSEILNNEDLARLAPAGSSGVSGGAGGGGGGGGGGGPGAARGGGRQGTAGSSGLHSPLPSGQLAA
ncbi:hypothetical protein HYH02_008586, partial [Chlamydomonas schloesseri]